MTDETLMYKVTQNSTESASELYDRYSKRLYNYFLKISFDKELSNDLLQNTFLRMLKYRNTYHIGKSFETWIFQIARNVFADHLKSNKLLVDKHQDIYSLDHSEDEESAEKEIKENRLKKALARLPGEAREILILSRFQSMRYEQIGQILNITVPNVKVRVHRALKKLRECYLEIEKI